MKINELDDLLNKTPVVCKGDLLPLCYIDNIKVIYDINNFISLLDTPSIMQNDRLILKDDNNVLNNKFPIVSIDENIFNNNLNTVIFDKYDFINKYAFSQNNIANYIVENSNYDLIILIMVDGLSYIDCKNINNIVPCFVNGITITEVGFRNIINDPPIAFQLFEKGFKTRFGFSYWDRTNELTDIFFKGFTPQQMFKVGEFDAIIEELSHKSLYKSYVQIIVNGCDQIAHNNRDRPFIKYYIDRIFNEYLTKISNLCKDKKLKSKIIITSDHGIWWKPNIIEIKDSILINYKTNHNRYIEGNISNKYLKNITCYNNDYSILKYPYIFMDYAINVWGIHGGISIYESFVPFFTLDVNI